MGIYYKDSVKVSLNSSQWCRRYNRSEMGIPGLKRRKGVQREGHTLLNGDIIKLRKDFFLKQNLAQWIHL